MLALLSILIAPMQAPDEGAPAPLRSEFVFEEAPFDGCHASTIAEVGGELVCAFFAGTEEGNEDVSIWTSHRGEAGWTAPRRVADGVQHADKRYPCWNPVLHPATSDRLLLFYKVGPSPRAWWGMLAESSDGGRTWSVPRRLPEDVLGPVRNHPIALGDGRLLCPSSTEHDGWRVHFELTDDLGLSWRRVGPVADPEGFGAIQPAIFVHADGRLHALCRSKKRRVAETWSEDGGLTWSPLRASALPNPNSGLDGQTLADGRHLLVYNHTQRGRSPLNVAVSEDGVDWRAALVLEDEAGEYSYPSVAQGADGTVHVTYTWRRERIRYVAIDPGRLDSKPMVDGKWPD